MLFAALTIAFAALPVALCGPKDAAPAGLDLIQHAARDIVTVAPLYPPVRKVKPRQTTVDSPGGLECYEDTDVPCFTCETNDRPCSSCNQAFSTFAVCASLITGFYESNDIAAGCLCYDWNSDGSSSTWVGDAFDRPYSACTDYANTIDTDAASGFQSMVGFCSSMSTEVAAFLASVSATATSSDDYYGVVETSSSFAVSGSSTSSTTAPRQTVTATAGTTTPRETVTATAQSSTAADSTSATVTPTPAASSRGSSSLPLSAGINLAAELSVLGIVLALGAAMVLI